MVGGQTILSVHTVVEEWNGSAWTETTDINTAKRQDTGTGANAEAAIAFGGYKAEPAED